MKTKHTNFDHEVEHHTQKSHWLDYAILIIFALALAVIVFEFTIGKMIV